MPTPEEAMFALQVLQTQNVESIHGEVRRVVESYLAAIK